MDTMTQASGRKLQGSTGRVLKKAKTEQSDTNKTNQHEGPKRLSLFDVIEKEDQMTRSSDQEDSHDNDSISEEEEQSESRELKALNHSTEKDDALVDSELDFDNDIDKRHELDKRHEHIASRKITSEADSDFNETASTFCHTESADIPHSAESEIGEVAAAYKLRAKLPTPKAISNIFQKKQLKKLTEVLNDVESQYPTELQEYKEAVKLRERKADKLIKLLLEQNKTLETRVESLRQKLTTTKQEKNEILKDSVREINRWKSISFSAKELEDELESEILSLKSEMVKNKATAEFYETKLNFLELLTGVHCVDLKEARSFLTFTIRQTGKLGSLYYKLIIGKTSSNDKPVDVVYEPLWEKPDGYGSNWEENVSRVKEALPDYLHSELSFPLNTLLMFYNKISVSLA